MSPTSVGEASTALFEGLAAKGVFPITNTYGRYTVGTCSVVTFLAIRGVGVVAIALRRHTGFERKFDHCWRFAQFFELHQKPCIPDAVSLILKLYLVYFIYSSLFSFSILSVPRVSTIFSLQCSLSNQINWASNLRHFTDTQLIFISFKTSAKKS